MSSKRTARPWPMASSTGISAPTVDGFSNAGGLLSAKHWWSRSIMPMNDSATNWDISERARALHSDALVWDTHAGFAYAPDQDLQDLLRWLDAGVNYLSVNVGFDVPPWSRLAIEALSSYRRQLR